MSWTAPIASNPGNTLMITDDDQKPRVWKDHPVFCDDSGIYRSYITKNVAEDIKPYTLMGVSISHNDIPTKEVHVKGQGVVTVKNTSKNHIFTGNRVGIFIPTLFDPNDYKNYYIADVADANEIPCLVTQIDQVEPAKLIMDFMASKVSTAPVAGAVIGGRLNFHAVIGGNTNASLTTDPLAQFTQIYTRNLMRQGRNVIRVLGARAYDGTMAADGIANTAFEQATITQFEGNVNNQNYGTSTSLRTTVGGGGNVHLTSAERTYNPANDSLIPYNLWVLIQNGATTKNDTIEFLKAYDLVKRMVSLEGLAQTSAGPGEEFSIVLN